MRLLASLLFKTGNKEVLFYEHKKEKFDKTNLCPCTADSGRRGARQAGSGDQSLEHED